MSARDRGSRRLASALAAAAVLAAAAPLLAQRSSEKQGQADRVFLNGRIFTADPARPFAEALAVRGQALLAIGTSAEMRKLAGRGTDVVDLRGRFVAPGFIDAHAHLVGGSLSLEELRLDEAPDFAGVSARITAWAKANPEARWVTGEGWTYAAFPGGMPSRAQLDALVPDRPAFFSSYDGHTGWANSAALRLAEVEAAGASVFEVDLPQQLARKAGILAAAAVSVPPWVRAVPCDFAAADFDARLVRALAREGLRRSDAVAVVWEGVIGYLDDAAVDRSLRDLGSIAAGGDGRLEVREGRDTWDAWVAAFTPRDVTLRASVLPSRAADAMATLDRRLAGTGFALSATVSAGVIRCVMRPPAGSATVAATDAARTVIARHGGTMLIESAPPRVRPLPRRDKPRTSTSACRATSGCSSARRRRRSMPAE